MNISVKEVVTYGGHNLSANGSVNLTLKASYSELAKTISAMQMLNNDIKIKAKVPGYKAMKLGMFRIKDIKIDGDGESVLRFNTLNDFVEMSNLNLLPLNDSDTKEFAVLLEAEVEEEGEEEDEE